METEETKTQVIDIRIKASCELWSKFGKWMRVRGFQTRTEAIRAAMIQVTNFNGESQQKTA